MPHLILQRKQGVALSTRIATAGNNSAQVESSASVACLPSGDYVAVSSHYNSTTTRQETMITNYSSTGSVNWERRLKLLVQALERKQQHLHILKPTQQQSLINQRPLTTLLGVYQQQMVLDC